MKDVGLRIIDVIGRREVDSNGNRNVKFIFLGHEEWLKLMASNFYNTEITHKDYEDFFFYGYPLIRVMKDSFFEII